MAGVSGLLERMAKPFVEGTAKLFGKGGAESVAESLAKADAAASKAARKEPAFDAAQAAKPRMSAEESIAHIKKVAADKAAAEQAAKVKPLDFDPATPAGKIERGFDANAAKPATAAKTEDATTKVASTTAKESAVVGEKLGYMSARRIAGNSKIELIEKLEALAGKGQDGVLNKLIRETRVQGFTKAEREAIASSPKLAKDAPELQKRLLDLSRARNPLDPGFMGISGFLSPKLEGLKALGDLSVHNPISTAWNAFKTFEILPVKALIWSNNHRVAAGVGLGAFGAADLATRGDAHKLAADYVVTPYADAWKTTNKTLLGVGTGIVSALATPAVAKTVEDGVLATGELTFQGLSHGTSAVLQTGERATGIDLGSNLAGDKIPTLIGGNNLIAKAGISAQNAKEKALKDDAKVKGLLSGVITPSSNTEDKTHSFQDGLSDPASILSFSNSNSDQKGTTMDVVDINTGKVTPSTAGLGATSPADAKIAGAGALPKAHGKSADQSAEEAKEKAELEEKVASARRKAEEEVDASEGPAAVKAAGDKAADDVRKQEAAAKLAADQATSGMQGKTSEEKKQAHADALAKAREKVAADAAAAKAKLGDAENPVAGFGEKFGTLGVIGAFFAWDKNNSKVNNMFNAGVFAAIFSFLGKKLGIDKMLDGFEKEGGVASLFGGSSSKTYRTAYAPVREARNESKYGTDQLRQPMEPANTATATPPAPVPVKDIELKTENAPVVPVDAPAQNFPLQRQGTPVPPADANGTTPVAGTGTVAANMHQDNAEVFTLLQKTQARDAIQTAQASSKEAIKLFEDIKRKETPGVDVAMLAKQDIVPGIHQPSLG